MNNSKNNRGRRMRGQRNETALVGSTVEVAVPKMQRTNFLLICEPFVCNF